MPQVIPNWFKKQVLTFESNFFSIWDTDGWICPGQVLEMGSVGPGKQIKLTFSKLNPISKPGLIFKPGLKN